jgi:hypothetical protein
MKVVDGRTDGRTDGRRCFSGCCVVPTHALPVSSSHAMSVHGIAAMCLQADGTRRMERLVQENIIQRAVSRRLLVLRGTK